MFPIKYSFLFKSRWVALLWAAGILWFAYDFVGPSGDPAAANGSDAVQLTDASGAPVSPDEARQLEEVANRL
jgi:hypothetical protein